MNYGAKIKVTKTNNLTVTDKKGNTFYILSGRHLPLNNYLPFDIF